MGRRFARLASSLQPGPALSALAALEELHYPVAFGYTFGVLAIGGDEAVSALLHQCVLSAVSAAQRLLPLGQLEAGRIAWELKRPIMDTVARAGSVSFSEVCCFAHLSEVASMRHPCLPTRLFIS